MTNEESYFSKKNRPRRKHAGRPRANIDWEKVKIWIRGGGNATQIAAKLGVDRDTLYIRCLMDNKVEFSAFHQEHRAHGDLDLHLMQYNQAMKGNTRMLERLGEFRLGQVRNTGKEQPTIEDLAKGIAEGICRAQNPS